MTMSLSSLSGPDYARLNQVTPTQDDGTAGRWVAADESGLDGEQPYRRDDRYLPIGSAAVDDKSAAQADSSRFDTVKPALRWIDSPFES